jgi:hypothetical protein
MRSDPQEEMGLLLIHLMSMSCQTISVPRCRERMKVDTYERCLRLVIR